MSDLTSTTPGEDLNRIVESAKRLGIELDESEALQWLTAIASTQTFDGITVDIKQGVFGHRITMLDFSPEELSQFRNIGALVGFDDRPGIVETALSISGSAAQSKIQTYPGDADFFERVNIRTNTIEDAKTVLADVMQEKALSRMQGDGYQLIEVKFGNYPFDVVKNEQLIKKDSPISWKPEEVKACKIDAQTPDGNPVTITWEEASNNPGWCKLDWVVADPVHKHLVNASNMLDVTWESPDGEITPLDGYLDGYFQEVYLEAESIPLFTKLVKHVSSDALEDYVKALEKEIKKYLKKDQNFGKVAKRMYNVFRLTGKYEEAAFIRELFDEPTTMLYQVWSLIRTIDDCFLPDSTIKPEDMLSHCDHLIVNVVKVLEGEKETEIVRLLLRLKDILSRDVDYRQLSPQAEAARAEVINIVNNFFFEKLSSIPTIKQYMDDISLVM